MLEPPGVGEFDGFGIDGGLQPCEIGGAEGGGFLDHRTIDWRVEQIGEPLPGSDAVIPPFKSRRRTRQRRCIPSARTSVAHLLWHKGSWMLNRVATASSDDVAHSQCEANFMRKPKAD